MENAHVVYNNLVSEPKTAIKNIYTKFGWKYTEEYDKILDDYIRETDAKRDAVKKSKSKSEVMHTYEPAEFGLTVEELSTGLYAEYTAKFSVPMSKN